MGVVRKYRVKYAAYGGSGVRYSLGTKEFQSLRAAAEFARDLSDPADFMGIQAVEYGDLTPQERSAFALFADGKVKKF